MSITPSMPAPIMIISSGKPVYAGDARYQLLGLRVSLRGDAGQSSGYAGAGAIGILVAAQLHNRFRREAIFAGDLAKALAGHVGLELT